MAEIFGSIFPHSDYEQATLTTTDATATQILAKGLAEGQACSVWVYGTCTKSDSTENGSFFATALAYRQASGDTTVEGNQVDVNVTVTAGCTCDLSIAANTSQQELEVKVAGEASSTYYWRVKALFMMAP